MATGNGMTRAEVTTIANSMRPGGERWLLLQSARTEANDLDMEINTVLTNHSRCNSEIAREHAKLLHEEHRRLARLRRMKEKQMDMLVRALTNTANQQAGSERQRTQLQQQHFTHASPRPSSGMPTSSSSASSSASDSISSSTDTSGLSNGMSSSYVNAEHDAPYTFSVHEQHVVPPASLLAPLQQDRC